MSVKPLFVSDEVLQSTLEKFQGRLLEEKDLTKYHYFGLMYYTNTKYIYDPRIQFTIQLDITEIYENYLSYYKPVSERVTFTSFIKWLVIKAMFNTPFNWRNLNDNWYEFNNLAIEVTMRTKVNRELASYVLTDVAQCSWETFCLKQDEYKDGKIPFNAYGSQILPIHQIGYQILNVHLPRMTSYNITQRVINTQQPFVVFSDRYEEAGKRYLPFYLSYSHATLTPEDAENLIKNILTYGKMTPGAVLEATKLQNLLLPPKDNKSTPPAVDPNSSTDLPF